MPCAEGDAAQSPLCGIVGQADAPVVEEAGEGGPADHLTLAACRHGGSTELGEVKLCETQGMSLTGHSTASAYRLYAKRTAKVRDHAARKRRAHRESGAA